MPTRLARPLSYLSTVNFLSHPCRLRSILTQRSNFCSASTSKHRPAISPSRVIAQHSTPRSHSTSHLSAYMGDNIVNFYAGAPPLNRVSFQRTATDKVTGYLESPEWAPEAFPCGCMQDEDEADQCPNPLSQGQPLCKNGVPGELLLLSRHQVESVLGGSFATAPEGTSEPKLYEAARIPHTLPAIVFLGIDDRPDASQSSVPAEIDPENPKGVPYFAVDASNIEVDLQGGGFVEGRAAGTALSAWEAGVFAEARALIDWNARNKFCAACGSPTYSLWGGWKRFCTTALSPEEGKTPCFSTKGLHNFAYPRTDPVIIMGIIDPTGEKMLLGRQKSWPKGMYSCLAGFIEPGESFEDAVRREVLEEAGVVVGAVRYSSSQPWPFPSNLMVGCFGVADDSQKIRLDLDNELEDCQWFSRSAIQALLSTDAGTNLSRADHKLLEDKANKVNMEQANALAPADKIPGEGQSEVGQTKGLTRVPPKTAIAGQLVALWAAGGLKIE